MSGPPRHPIVQKWLDGKNDAGGCIAELEAALRKADSARVGPCQSPPARVRAWLVHFDDPDRRSELIEDQATAFKRFAGAGSGVHLFALQASAYSSSALVGPDELGGSFKTSPSRRQQTDKRGARDAVDDRATAPEVFDRLHERFRFTVDVCAKPHNAKLDRHFTPDMDGLAQSWAGERVWCNPPYSSIEPWLEKAWVSGAELIVMLLPANRTEQGWWQRHIEPRRDVAGGVRVEFLPGRMRFIAPGATAIGPNERPPFGVCLVIWDRTPPSSHGKGRAP